MAASKTSIPLNLSWLGSYADSIFGLPTLCVLGKGGMGFEEFKKAYGNSLTRKTTPNFQQKRVVIPGRYERLIRSLVQQDDVEYISLEGKVDVTAATDSSIDYAIDIVLSGKTCIREGLGIFATLFKSDGVLVYNRFSPLQNLINYGALTQEDKP